MKIHRVQLWGVLGLALLCAFPAVVHAEERWTLQSAVEAALEGNPDARVSALRIESASAAYDQAVSSSRPQLSLQSGYTQTNSPMMAFGSILNQRAFDFGLDFNHPGVIDNLNVTASVGLNLYAGGRVQAGRRAARSGLEIATQDEVAMRHQLIVATIRAYLDIRKSTEALRAMDAGVKAYDAAVFNAQARYDAGQLLKTDLLSLLSQQAQTQEQRLQVRHQRNLAARAFLFVLGREANSATIVEIADSDPALDGILPPGNLDYRNRPEILAWTERENAAAAMVAVARGERRPSVNAFASYQVDKGWETREEGDSWMGGVAVNMYIFDGGATSARIRMAEAQLSEVREYKRKIELGLNLEVEQARLSLDESRERLLVTESMLKHAEESASLSRARFEEGALLAAELIGVEGRLIEARMRGAIARADERIAVAELRRAVGLEAFSQNEQ